MAKNELKVTNQKQQHALKKLNFPVNTKSYLVIVTDTQIYTL